MREKQRYLVYEVLSKNKISTIKIKKELNEGLYSYLGILGLSQANVNFVDQYSNQGIILTNSKYMHHVKAALTLIANIDDIPVIINVKKVSGMLNKARETLK